MPRSSLSALCLLLLVSFAVPALAIMSDAENLPQAPQDADYAAGLAAVQRADWQSVLDAMARVVARRPWDDEAYTLMGFASRKLGNYRQSLAHYQQALSLNPHHRGALEYLGEAYVEMGCLAQAGEMLGRLETACRRLLSATASADWQAQCHEWSELQAAITASHASVLPPCPLQ